MTPALAIAVLLSAGCEGPQSTLDTAGTGAERIAELFWWMLSGALLIWLVVVGTAVAAMRGHGAGFSVRAARLLIVGGGVVFPTLVLGGLLAYGLQLLAQLRTPAAATVQIAVSGEQWWWRVSYLEPEREPVVLANEIRLPVGSVAELRLSSPDVIHSFWIPSLGGKMDMIPGRETRLILEPTRTGTFRGACAEYCGASHALMAFPVVVMEPDAFASWLDAQRRAAAAPQDATAQRGQRLFLANGCGACHSVRGTPADGRLGPDLTHVGSRLTLAAGTLPNDLEAFVRWLTATGEVKPEARMPAFDMLPEADVRAIARYLEGLR